MRKVLIELAQQDEAVARGRAFGQLHSPNLASEMSASGVNLPGVSMGDLSHILPNGNRACLDFIHFGPSLKGLAVSVHRVR
jgi:hypothetical protein